jgi:hypothetical protein
MAESGKLTDRAADLAQQAAAKAEPLRQKATQLAGHAASAAAPIAEQAKVRAAQGVDVVAGGLDKVTRGKYSHHIHTVASRVGDVLDGKPKPPAAGAADPLQAEPAPPAEPTAPSEPEAPSAESQ